MAQTEPKCFGNQLLLMQVSNIFTGNRVSSSRAQSTVFSEKQILVPKVP